MNEPIIVSLMFLFSSFLTSCNKENIFTKFTECDTTYEVQYSETSAFENIILTNKFFQKSVNKYSLQPNTMDKDYWMGQNGDLRKPAVRLYYARIVGKCKDEAIYISENTKWQNIGRALWVKSSILEDTSGYIIRSDENGKIIMKNKSGDHEVKVK